MTTTAGRPSSTHARRPTAMYVGLALTVLATLAPLLDIATVDTLSGHVRDAYPGWPPNLVEADRDAIAIYLVATGAVGTLLWLLTTWAVTTGRRWGRAATTAAFAAGALVALTDLGLGGDHYDVIVPYAYGTLTLLPCLAGLAAVVSVWRRGRPAPRR
ncbi:hypothetical protein [Nonomuraea roseoviolacea]|uniref:DUF998 domain-containing protein n=1 Tax=Nonomuraea roseoviolacea subsp. carminata TaxID=160689 RepID=A0ABT1K6V5_9ACTN|nr:hypothetical protein [Nonomuraea roseoviolacea]MCP2349327.1 hypothetical protein [Nonomuraea roseoviolacea subsp. carminata]